ncbi:MAG: endopeptidase La, partial [Clostridia bacterium]|nr:endopeptidase La [Clostridia bacterium]
PVFVESVVRRIRREFDFYASKGIKLAPDIALTISENDEPGYLADYIAFNIPLPLYEKQSILSELSPIKRAKKIIELIRKESQIVDIDKKIGEQVKSQIDDNQREYYLREQIKAINFELYGDTDEDEVEEYLAKIDALSAADSVKEKLGKEVMKLHKMPQGSHEATVVRNYLDLCLELPWNRRTAKDVKVSKAAKILNRDFYAMDKVKERILEMLSVYALSPEIRGQIICLVGPPGVGKTSIARSIAECMGRSFARISLGGISDEAEIRGHRKTYIGAMPGKIISAVKDAGSADPLILLDEIDKLGRDYKGDPSAALLEVLDGEQNDTFVDHFVDMPFDLSRAVFLTTANTEATIPEPLRDRMEIISLTSYTREEKFHIAKEHLVKRQVKNHGLTPRQIKITDDAIYSVIDFYTREAGVRKLERTIATLCRKSAKMIAEGEKSTVKVNAEMIRTMLGKKRYIPEEILEKDEVGIINGLAWTSVGGEIMQLEVAVLSGSGKLELTGSLGDVMQESAKTALSYVRANAEKYGINPDFYKDKDIHIHATEGAVPKDGPSAGVAITTALVSALTGREIRRDIA